MSEVIKTLRDRIRSHTLQLEVLERNKVDQAKDLAATEAEIARSKQVIAELEAGIAQLTGA